MAEIEKELLKYTPAFELLASNDLKLFKFILVELKFKRIVFNMMISRHLNWSKSKTRNLIDKWVEKGIIEKNMQCPFCNSDFNNYITPVCNSCQKRIIQEDLKFKDKKHYPRFIIAINEKNKEILINLFRYCAIFLEFLMR